MRSCRNGTSGALAAEPSSSLLSGFLLGMLYFLSISSTMRYSSTRILTRYDLSLTAPSPSLRKARLSPFAEGVNNALVTGQAKRSTTSTNVPSKKATPAAHLPPGDVHLIHARTKCCLSQSSGPCSSGTFARVSTVRKTGPDRSVNGCQPLESQGTRLHLPFPPTSFPFALRQINQPGAAHTSSPVFIAD